MKLDNIEGVGLYLDTKCYCKNEVYSSDGFFYQLFPKDTECKYLGKNESHHMVVCKDQILLFYFHKEDESNIVDSIRYDATKNNIEMCVLLAKGKQVKEFIEEGRKLDRFKDNNTDRDLKKILDMADAVMISR